MGQAPNASSIMTRINAADDAPAEPDALGTAACDVTKVHKREGARLEPIEPSADRAIQRLLYVHDFGDD